MTHIITFVQDMLLVVAFIVTGVVGGTFVANLGLGKQDVWCCLTDPLECIPRIIVTSIVAAAVVSVLIWALRG